LLVLQDTTPITKNSLKISLREIFLNHGAQNSIPNTKEGSYAKKLKQMQMQCPKLVQNTPNSKWSKAWIKEPYILCNKLKRHLKIWKRGATLENESKQRFLANHQKSWQCGCVWPKQEWRKGCKVLGGGGFLYISKASSALKLSNKLTYRILKISVSNFTLLLWSI